jgi:hypothetical protein
LAGEERGLELEKAARVEADRRLVFDQGQDHLQGQYSARQWGKEQAKQERQKSRGVQEPVGDAWAAGAAEREQQRQRQEQQQEVQSRDKQGQDRAELSGAERSRKEGRKVLTEQERLERSGVIQAERVEREGRMVQNSTGQKKRKMEGQQEEHQVEQQERVSSKEPD